MSDNAPNTIDETQRWNDVQEMILSSNDSQQSQMWTSIPAIVIKHNDNGTVEVQPAIKQKHVKTDGKSEWMEFPPLKSVPIQYPGGGGASWTFPVKEGDEVLLCCASRNIDKWHKDGGVQEQPTPFRMHDMNDAFAIPGFRSQKRKLENVSMKTAQLRIDDGKMVIDFDPENKQITIKSPEKPVRIEGSLEVTGEVKTGGDVKGGKEVFAHAGTNGVQMNWSPLRPASSATLKTPETMAAARGTWMVAPNLPNISNIPREDGDYWVADTVDPAIPETPPLGQVAGLDGVMIPEGYLVTWHEDLQMFIATFPVEIDPDDPIYEEPWVGVMGVLVTGADPFSVVGDVATAITKVNDIFNIAGAINQKVPQISAIFNGVFKVAGILNNLNFNTLVNAIPSQIGAIIGNPILSAAIKLATHDHHGVRAGAEISQKPVTGT